MSTTPESLSELKDLKGVYSTGYTISKQYSTRKVDVRSTIEYPILLEQPIVFILEKLQTLKSVHASAIQAYDSQFFESEEEFFMEMIPTYHELLEVAGTIRAVNSEETSDIGKFYLRKAVDIFNHLSANIKTFDIAEKAKEMTNSGL